ncbi:putative transcription factor B3-Domain family [Rosa chinensis]|uniref:Putative transcription factor B3-Domain family n=1 Tax=Rosa chinensis TaxID=74649 RepID=A0A2P6RMY2_ROSCH|nr:putative transcription factor B3-Domain family [Rosa chinensis]
MGSLGRKIFCAITPHFFKIILEDTSREHKLKIPKKFMIKYGEDLSNSVCLKLPSGSEWEVELTRCNGKAWFERGWPEFSRFCSLNYGTFLVFRYEGNSHFEVCIFDTSATEIDYPLTIPKIEEADEDDLSIDISEDLPPCPKSRENSSSLCPRKKMRTSLSGKLDMISENGNTQPYDMVVLEKPVTNKDSHCSKAEIKSKEYISSVLPQFVHLMPSQVTCFAPLGETDFATKTDGGCFSRPERFPKQTCHENLGRMKPLTTTEKAIALQRANAFKSDKPSFKMAMQPSHIHGGTISLPYEFAKRHLIKLPAGIAILRVSDGRTWSVMFKYDHKNSKARLWRSGWSSFVRDNNLKVGDVCVFVLIDCNKLSFEVFFYPTIEATNCRFSPGYGRGAIVQVEEKKRPIFEAESNMNCEIGVSTSIEVDKSTRM